MEHPQHLIVTTRGRRPERLAGFAFAVLLNVALIVALIAGLMPKIVSIPPDVFQLVPINETHPKDTHPPVIPPMVNPVVRDTIPPPPIPHPDNDQNDTITLPQGSGGTNGQVMSIPPVPAHGIVSTHTIPPYPELAIRMDEQGTVTLRLAVATDGTVSDAQVIRSSGHDELDRAAVAWVKAHWRYQPATDNGTAVASTTDANVVFNLNDPR